MLSYYAADMRARRLSPNTIKARLVVARVLDRSYNPATVTAEQLAAHTAAWVRLSPQTHSSYLQHLADLCAWMVRNGIRDDDPSTGLLRPRIPRRLPRPITEPDLARALAAADPLMRAWLVLAAWAGLRCCEIASLDRADLLEGAVRVRGKGDKERVVPMGAVALREVHRAPMARAGACFRSRLGDAFTSRSVSERIADHLHGLGIEASAHCLRHRFGTRILQLSGDIRLCQELLGHESVMTTQVYTAYSRPAAAAAVAALDAELAPTQAA